MNSWYLGVISGDFETEQRIAREIELAIGGILPVAVMPRARVPSDAKWIALLTRNAQTDLVSTASKAREAGAEAIFLLIHEQDAVPQELETGIVDDVLIAPVRALDVLSRISHVETLMKLDQISEMQKNLAGTVGNFQDDLKILEGLHKARLPKRFPDFRGFQLECRHLSGMRSGGDHFDVLESKEGSRLSLLLSDSSSYGLSSAVLAAFMRVAQKASTENVTQSGNVVRSIYDDVKLTLKPKDQLSLFFGILSKRDLTLSYSHLGSVGLFHSVDQKPFVSIGAQAGPMTIQKNPLEQSGIDSTLKLTPKDRLVLLSDGFIEAAGGADAARKMLDSFRARDSKDLLNEWVYRVKSSLPSSDDLPEQDCSALVLDIGANMLRLAPV